MTRTGESMTNLKRLLDIFAWSYGNLNSTATSIGRTTKAGAIIHESPAYTIIIYLFIYL